MTTSLLTVQETLAEMFGTEMATSPVIPVIWENAKNLGADRDPGSAPWVRWSFRPTIEQPSAIGRTFFRLFGLVDVQIFTPLQSGAGPGYTIAERIRSLYWDSEITGIWIPNVGYSSVGETDGWHQTQCRVSFQADIQA